MLGATTLRAESSSPRATSSSRWAPCGTRRTINSSTSPVRSVLQTPGDRADARSDAAVFLLKLIRPEFRAYCDPPAILGLVHDVVELFDKVAIDETHTPALYASFLRVLVTSKELSTAPSRAERVTVDGVVKNDQPTPEAIDAALRRSQLAQDALPAPPGASATAEAPAVPNAGLLGLDPFSDGRVLDGIWETMLMRESFGALSSDHETDVS